MSGFFQFEDLEKISAVPRCGVCGRSRGRNRPQELPLDGKGRKRVLILTGLGCDGEREAFSGALRKKGWNLQRDCWWGSVMPCGKKEPTPNQIRACFPLVQRTVNEKKPEIILLIGGTAIESVIGGIWKKSVGNLSRWTGRRIPWTDWGAWVCPLGDLQQLSAQQNRGQEVIWDRELSEALDCPGGFSFIPGEHEIEIIYSPDQAADILREFFADPAPLAFDYEANMLKPDSQTAEIVSCAVTWRGERTIAFPWEGEAVKAMKKLLLSPDHGKIASNIKFEERWTKAKLGIRVENWWWDTMLAAHVLDNRSGVTSIKFQSFVLLGAKSYDDEVGPFLRSEKPNEPNRIRECDMKKLLKYNALDAKLEYQVAMKQMRLFGYPFAQEENEDGMPKVPKNNSRRRGSF